MIKILSGNNIELKIDPNPNGYPYLIFEIRYGDKIKYSCFLGKSETKELIKELQNKLKDLIE